MVPRFIASCLEYLFFQEDICWSSIELQEVVGTGAFGQVWKALWSDEVVAVKRLHTIDPEPVVMFLKEMALMWYVSFLTPETDY